MPTTMRYLRTRGAGAAGPADAEQLRPYVGAKLAVASMLDGSAIVPVGHWGLGRSTGLGLVDLVAPIEPGRDVVPVELGTVCGTVDTRGTPAALIGIARDGSGFVRTWIPVEIDGDDSGGRGAPPSPPGSPISDAPPAAGAPGSARV